MKELNLRNVAMMALVASSLMQVGAQLFASQRTVVEINATSKALHFADERGVTARVAIDVFKKSRHRRMRRHKDQSFIERRYGSFQQREHALRLPR